MIGEIKNIRFTYQWENPKYPSSQGKMGGNSGWLRGDAAAQKGAPPHSRAEPKEPAMPALTALAISAAIRARRNLKRLLERMKNRHDATRLASLDDRMLADIGLNRSDLRDAFAELPWRDPSDVLARRAAERRSSRRLTDVGALASR
jgi:uncharacterized protein YjiS (DUF1127 family)